MKRLPPKPEWMDALATSVAMWMPYESEDDAGGLLAAIEPHIKAAEQRGFSAAASKVGQRQAAEIKELKAKLDQVRDLVREYHEGQDRGLMPAGRAFASWVQDVVGPKAD